MSAGLGSSRSTDGPLTVRGIAQVGWRRQSRAVLPEQVLVAVLAGVAGDDLVRVDALGER
jgi:hypothetical protein